MDSRLSSSSKISQVTVTVAVAELPALFLVAAVRVKSILVYRRLGDAYLGVCAVTFLRVCRVVLLCVAEYPMLCSLVTALVLSRLIRPDGFIELVRSAYTVFFFTVELGLA